MTPQKGNPYLQIRLEPRMHERLKETAGDGGPGKAGGVALFVRRLIYRELKEPSKDLADLLELEAKVLAWEDEPAGLLTDEIEATFKELWELCFTERDTVRRNFVFQILGRLTAGFAEGGMIHLSNPRTCRKEALEAAELRASRAAAEHNPPAKAPRKDTKSHKARPKNR